MQQVQEFVDSNPLNVIIRDMLKKYEFQTDEVNNLPDRHVIGSIEINMGNFSIAIGSEQFYIEHIYLLCNIRLWKV